MIRFHHSAKAAAKLDHYVGERSLETMIKPTDLVKTSIPYTVLSRGAGISARVEQSLVVSNTVLL